jgi:hypothetical protein
MISYYALHPYIRVQTYLLGTEHAGPELRSPEWSEFPHMGRGTINEYNASRVLTHEGVHEERCPYLAAAVFDGLAGAVEHLERGG